MNFVGHSSAAASLRRPAVQIFNHYAARAWQLPLCRRDLHLALVAMLHALAQAGAQAPSGVELHLLNDRCMSAANRKFMSCQGPTNVLSFPGGQAAAGILLLSLDTLARECLLYGQPPVRHALRLLAHGMGHLTGLDHGPAMDALCARCLAAAENRLQL